MDTGRQKGMRILKRDNPSLSGELGVPNTVRESSQESSDKIIAEKEANYAQV